MKKQFLKIVVLSVQLFIYSNLFAQEKICNKIDDSFQPNVGSMQSIPDPLPDTPIDSNLYVLLFAALCYGVYQRKHLMSLVIRG